MARPIAAKNTSITLGAHFNGFIREQIASGRFGSASELVRAALRMLEEHETKLSVLRSALEEGERSGVAKGYSLERLLSRVERNVR
jgi:antitoxin ParD1/3/4